MASDAVRGGGSRESKRRPVEYLLTYEALFKSRVGKLTDSTFRFYILSVLAPEGEDPAVLARATGWSDKEIMTARAEMGIMQVFPDRKPPDAASSDSYDGGPLRPNQFQKVKPIVDWFEELGRPVIGYGDLGKHLATLYDLVQRYTCHSCLQVMKNTLNRRRSNELGFTPKFISYFFPVLGDPLEHQRVAMESLMEQEKKEDGRHTREA